MDAVLDSLGVNPGMTIAEVGAGWGYLTFKLARRVAPDGIVLAEDIEQRWLDTLKSRADERGLTNIQMILGKETDPLFPSATLDFIFIHAVLQWIVDRPAFLRTAGDGLKPDGLFVIIEPEAEGENPAAHAVASGGYPTRRGYLELFRKAGFEVVSAERRPNWIWPVFVLKKKSAA
jgi:ubiquinone/menaquinone biosynthesis C-methylase UbiE